LLACARRINHFNEWLANFQAKETMEIPQSIIDQVMEEFHKQRVRKVSDITARKVREVLKQLRLRKTYEHTSQITARITGVPAPRLSAATEEMCRLLFKATQPAFERHKPADRSNFLSYSYTLCVPPLISLAHAHAPRKVQRRLTQERFVARAGTNFCSSSDTTSFSIGSRCLRGAINS
jgi:hypothetical protein